MKKRRYILYVESKRSANEGNTERAITEETQRRKLVEKLVYTHILNFIYKHNILYKHQFGFRQVHPPIMLLLHLLINYPKL